ncbi:MAG: hypothetical protein KIT16_05120 [Rhodospirillaceae bacterium]|nr:hypothetical protein [Rhodospirillaceae bacterium]
MSIAINAGAAMDDARSKLTIEYVKIGLTIVASLLIPLGIYFAGREISTVQRQIDDLKVLSELVTSGKPEKQVMAAHIMCVLLARNRLPDDVKNQIASYAVSPNVAMEPNVRRLIVRVGDNHGCDTHEQAQATLRQSALEVTANQGEPAKPAAPAPSLVFVQVATAKQREVVRNRLAEESNRDSILKNRLAIPSGIEIVGGRAPQKSELRYFHTGEQADAALVAEILAKALRVRVAPKYVTLADATKVPANQFELWIGKSDLAD